jgi:hypothetical protein
MAEQYESVHEQPRDNDVRASLFSLLGSCSGSEFVRGTLAGLVAGDRFGRSNAEHRTSNCEPNFEPEYEPSSENKEA